MPLLEYAYWKKRFFKNCKKVLLNRDDPFSFEIAADKNGVCSWYSASVCADGYASEIEKDVEIDGLYQHFLWHWQKMPARSISLKLPGLCNVSNAAAALSAFCLLTSDEQYDSYQLDFSTFSVQGALEMVGHFQGGTIMIDYTTQ